MANGTFTHISLTPTSCFLGKITFRLVQVAIVTQDINNTFLLLSHRVGLLIYHAPCCQWLINYNRSTMVYVGLYFPIFSFCLDWILRPSCPYFFLYWYLKNKQFESNSYISYNYFITAAMLHVFMQLNFNANTVSCMYSQTLLHILFCQNIKLLLT